MGVRCLRAVMARIRLNRTGRSGGVRSAGRCVPTSMSRIASRLVPWWIVGRYTRNGDRSFPWSPVCKGNRKPARTKITLGASNPPYNSTRFELDAAPVLCRGGASLSTYIRRANAVASAAPRGARSLMNSATSSGVRSRRSSAGYFRLSGK